MIDKLLDRAVKIAAGESAVPHPGQLELTEDVWRTVNSTADPFIEGGSPRHAAGIAPTGVGKSFALLVPAVASAAILGKRTIISTESKTLQAQVIDKDAPVVVEAVTKELELKPHQVPRVTILKGMSNYFCHAKLESTTEELLEQVPKSDAHLLPKTVDINGSEVPTSDLAQVLHWINDLPANHEGDRQSYTRPLEQSVWDLVSSTSGECLRSKCKFAAQCKSKMAREKAAAASVVVTNHAMLGIQAAKGVSILVGNDALGRFDTIMVDEAHALPGTVRSQGASKLGGRTLVSISKALEKLLGKGKLSDDGVKLADELKNLIWTSQDVDVARELSKSTRDTKQYRIDQGDQPLGETAGRIRAWVAQATLRLDPIAARYGDRKDDDAQKELLKVNRVKTRLASLLDTVAEVSHGSENSARWFEFKKDRGEWSESIQISPVITGDLLSSGLWNAGKADPIEDDDFFEGQQEDLGHEPLSVVAVSATLGEQFHLDAGLNPILDDGGWIKEYESPLGAAYGKSLLYVPKPTPEVLGAVSMPKPGEEPRRSFSIAMHRSWAAAQIVDLVEHNAGSALILSATSEGAVAYAEALKAAAHGRWQVFHQDKRTDLRQLIADWKEDEDSILVGTKSLMTGVDGKGDTCTLVVLDRIPRAAANPVDDTRVEILRKQGWDKWEAADRVYAADAALTLEQAAGRLIRGIDDYGTFALLDPRMTKGNAIRYGKGSLERYKGALMKFPSRTDDPAVVAARLAAQSASDSLAA